MEQRKTYTVKVANGDVWVFKYNLKGVLVFFDVLEGDLSDAQENFLYITGKFPWRENQIITWAKTYKTIQVEIGDRDLSFDAFWSLYPTVKLSNKKTAKERFEKLKPAEIEKLFIETPNFIKLKKQENQFFPYCEVYIRGRWWDK